MNENIKKLIDLAIESNVIVFDIDAKPLVFSNKLIIIDTGYLTKTYNEKLEAIIHDECNTISEYIEELNKNDKTLYLELPYLKRRFMIFVTKSHAILGSY
jgi:hypothetical protein